MRLAKGLFIKSGIIFMALFCFGFTFIPKTEEGKALNKYVAVGKYADMVEDAQKILKDKPEHIEVRKILAVGYMMTGQFDGALSEIRKVLSKDKNALSANQLLMLLLTPGDLSEAAEVAEKILEINPNDADAYYTLGLYYRTKINWGIFIINFLLRKDLEKSVNRKNLEKSVKCFTRVYELNPKRELEISNKLMSTYILLDNFKEAKTIGEKALEKTLSENYLPEKGADKNLTIEEAYIIGDKKMSVRENVPLIAFYLSICYAHDNNKLDAIKFLQKAINFNKDMSMEIKEKAEKKRKLFGNVGKMKEFEDLISRKE